MKPDIAVLGVGAIEQHGPHLPIGTDWLIAKELSKRVAIALNALLLPTIPISMSECHGSFGGTVWLKPATLSAVVKDLVLSLHEQDILNLLVVNCHGGNFVLNPTIHQLNHEYPDMQIILSDETWPMSSNGKSIFEQSMTDLHAGEIETSLMMFLYPEFVKTKRVDYVPSFGREFLDYVTMDQISAEGVWGSSSKGTADKGSRAMTAQVEKITAYALNKFRMNP